MSLLVLLNISLFALLVATAIAITRLRALYEATMLTALASLLSASLFVVLDAVDVAVTEAAVGAGITTVLFLGVLALTRSREAVTPRRKILPGAAVAALMAATLMYAGQDLPPFAEADTPVQTHPVGETYIEESQKDIGIPNTVTAVLASYRGYDTLGELIVVFTAGITVPLLLMRPRRRGDRDGRDGRAEPRENRLVEYRILRVISKILLPFIFIFACYVLFHGDYGPGGGFQAGVIFASGFVLYGLVFGIKGIGRVVPWPALLSLIPVGVLLYAGFGLFDMALGGNFLDYDTLFPTHPKESQHIGILLIETGVGITVAAVLIAVFYSFTTRGAPHDR